MTRTTPIESFDLDAMVRDHPEYQDAVNYSLALDQDYFREQFNAIMSRMIGVKVSVTSSNRDRGSLFFIEYEDIDGFALWYLRKAGAS